MRSAPRASVTEITIGSSSGVRPTASAIANRNDSSSGLCVEVLTMSTNSTMSTVSRMISMPKRRVPSSKAVGGGSRLSVWAISPSAVAAPVRQTSRRPVPLTTDVPMKSAFVAPARSACRSVSSPASLLHREGLAGEQRLVHEQVARLEQSAVRRHQAAGRKHHDVARHDLRCRHLLGDAVAQHAGANLHRLAQPLRGLARRDIPGRSRASRSAAP